MTIRYVIRDGPNGNLVYDPEQSQEWLSGVSWKTSWPGGYRELTGKLNRNLLDRWAVAGAYDLTAYDGQKIVYQGRLRPPRKSRSSSGDAYDLTALGYLVRLSEQSIRKRWIDQEGLSRLRWPSAQANDAIQNQVSEEIGNAGHKVILAPDDTALTTSDDFQLEWVAPEGTIRRVIYDYIFRTGEGFDVILYNVDQASTEDTENMANASVTTGTVNHLFAGGSTTSFILQVQPDGADTYDQNDFVTFQDMTVHVNYESGHSQSTPAYTNGELVEDVLLLARGSELSADVSQITDPGLALDKFTTRDDAYETAMAVIERLAALSDTSDNTYGVAVWDGGLSSDGLPQFYFEARSVADYEYRLRLADLPNAILEETDRDLWNYITVRYTDELGRPEFITPDDEATLTDSTSTSRWDTRIYPLDVGEVSYDDALQAGERFLAYHKDPLWQGQLTLSGTIESKAGGQVPVSHIRAGQRIRIVEMDETIFIRETTYRVDTDTITITPDLPLEDIA